MEIASCVSLLHPQLCWNSSSPSSSPRVSLENLAVLLMPLLPDGGCCPHQGGGGGEVEESREELGRVRSGVQSLPLPFCRLAFLGCCHKNLGQKWLATRCCPETRLTRGWWDGSVWKVGGLWGVCFWFYGSTATSDQCVRSGKAECMDKIGVENSHRNTVRKENESHKNYIVIKFLKNIVSPNIWQ